MEPKIEVRAVLWGELADNYDKITLFDNLPEAIAFVEACMEGLRQIIANGQIDFLHPQKPKILATIRVYIVGNYPP